jgi:hypothetical protein
METKIDSETLNVRPKRKMLIHGQFVTFISTYSRNERYKIPATLLWMDSQYSKFKRSLAIVSIHVRNAFLFNTFMYKYKIDCGIQNERDRQLARVLCT